MIGAPPVEPGGNVVVQAVSGGGDVVDVLCQIVQPCHVISCLVLGAKLACTYANNVPASNTL